MPDNPVVQVICVAVAYIVTYYGLLKPLGVGSRQYGPALPDKTRDERIAELECSTNICAHAVDDEHPVRVVTQSGKRYWRLADGRMWEEGTPCPFR